jgi:DNA-binding response OmpR family regulator
MFKSSKNMNCPRILIVNDESALREFFRINLAGRGCDVLVASGSPRVLAIIQKEEPDLVIINIAVKGVDGIELCRQICQSSLASVLAFSLHGNESEMLRCLKIGVDDYLGKPFGMDELMARVWAVLRCKKFAKPSLTTHCRIKSVGYYSAGSVSGKDTERNRMNLTVLLENSTPLSLTESWARSCTVLIDRPLSAVYWNLGKMTGEGYLDELAQMQAKLARNFYELN